MVPSDLTVRDNAPERPHLIQPCPSEVLGLRLQPLAVLALRRSVFDLGVQKLFSSVLLNRETKGADGKKSNIVIS